MSILICPKAYRQNNDKRGKIMCKVSGTICAHQYLCQVTSKYRQTDGANDCLGRSQDGK